MKQTTTEIFIEVEETICVKSARSKKSDEDARETLKPVIEICPHCHQAIFEPQIIELKGEEKL